MQQIEKTNEYQSWFTGLVDAQVRARIEARIVRLALGNAGDAAPVGNKSTQRRDIHLALELARNLEEF